MKTKLLRLRWKIKIFTHRPYNFDKMTDKSIKVLLIEDNVGDTRLIQEMLATVIDKSYKLTSSDRLSSGLDVLSREEFDIVLTDLGLPDSLGLNTFIKIYEQVPRTPIIILTELDDENLAITAVQKGAQDYLVKGRLEKDLLVRSIHYSIERNRLKEHQREQEARLLASLERISKPSKTNVTEQMFEVLSLKDMAPEFFTPLVQRFKQVLDNALEQRVFRIAYDVEKELCDISKQLGSVKAGPRDVIDIYIEVLKLLGQNLTPEKAQAYTEEGRILLLELMGHLVTFYRDYFSTSIYNQTVKTTLSRKENSL